jgi:AraC family transcriptional regulator
LRARFRESVGLRHVAREAGVHPVYLARVFRRRHGCSVGEYLRVLRLVEAGRLVLEGAALAQAAHEAGFADQAHFSRCFSGAFGFTPKGLRPARTLLQNHRLVSFVQDRD